MTAVYKGNCVYYILSSQTLNSRVYVVILVSLLLLLVTLYSSIKT